MTYCMGLLLQDGAVLLSDTRTNAGVDNIATFGKMHVFETPGERVFVVMTAGNLAITQSVINVLIDGLVDEASGELETLDTVPTMFRAAQFVGKAVRHIYNIDGEELKKHGVSFDASFIVAGQIKNRNLRLFEVYSAGNFIEATADTPFLQIGEIKYGKPILDRAATYETSLSDGVKLSLISMDSTLRSNLSVGLPVDLVVIERDRCRVGLRRRVTDQDEGYKRIHAEWSEALRRAYRAIEPPGWLADLDGQSEAQKRGN